MDRNKVSEWELLRIFWVKGESVARDVYNELVKKGHRNYFTFGDTLDKMVRYGMLKRRMTETNRYSYDVTEPKETTIQTALKEFVNTYLGDNITLLIEYFLSQGKISGDDIIKLRQVIKVLDKRKKIK